jgi:hypothetical protein
VLEERSLGEASRRLDLILQQHLGDDHER